jgi:hypothetical protein
VTSQPKTFVEILKFFKITKKLENVHPKVFKQNSSGSTFTILFGEVDCFDKFDLCFLKVVPKDSKFI